MALYSQLIRYILMVTNGNLTVKDCSLINLCIIGLVDLATLPSTGSLPDEAAGENDKDDGDGQKCGGQEVRQAGHTGALAPDTGRLEGSQGSIGRVEDESSRHVGQVSAHCNHSKDLTHLRTFHHLEKEVRGKQLFVYLRDQRSKKGVRELCQATH